MTCARFNATPGAVNDDRLRQTLRRVWGFDDFRPGQREVMHPLLEGASAAAVFPTGGGKSLCYQLPALLFEGLTLVVSPLIALMKDQIDALAERGVYAARLDSSLSREAFLEVMEAVRRGECRLLYVAPERFNNERFRRAMAGIPIALFAVDEAHCISEWGHNFRPDYLKLVGYATELGAERVLALTATATPEVLDDICRAFAIDPAHAVVRPFHRPNLHLAVEAVAAVERDELLVRRLRATHGATIVYVTQQKTAERLAEHLVAAGIEAIAYHAGLKAERRAALQERFMADEVRVVVATIAFGMGVDKREIRHVVHYNLPKSLEGYAQEVGRAGRDGEPSTCVTLICPDDVAVLESFALGDTPTRPAVERLVENVFDAPPGGRVELSYISLSHATDVRILVVRTLLTYLELDGYLRAETPFYENFRFKPKSTSKEILAGLEEPRRAFMRSLLRLCEKKRTWIYIDVEAASARLQAPRAEVIGALEALHENNSIELESSGMRFPYRVLRAPEDGLVDGLYRRSL
ncbi:MAG: ATP-dependent DNA helicase RecQ, partial [Myxococcota bacterium]